MFIVETKSEIPASVLSVIMSAKAQVLPSINDLLKNASLDKGLESEPGQNLNEKQQWSERRGQDVEFDRALAGWIINQRSKWRESRQPETRLNQNAIP
jgi:hypothetical protein